MARIELTDIRKVYAGGVEAVKGVSLSIDDGEFVVLVGPSGCGKSTLLRMVAGLESITSGTVRIGERVVNELEPAERDIAMVFQNYALYPHMSVRQNLEYGLKNRKMAMPEIARRVDEAAGILEIAPLLDRKPGQLSGGQRQRVAMGRAIVREPAAFLFDEPLSNLDAKLRVQMRAEIRRLQRRLATTSLYVTHDQLEAMTLADQLVVMNGGRIEQAGRPMDLYERPASLFVATFIGSPAMNLVPLDSTGGAGEGLAGLDGLPGAASEGVVLGIRPEHMRLVEAGREPGEFVADLTVTGVEVVGAESYVFGALAEKGPEIAVRVPGYSHLEPGTKVRAAGRLDAVHRFDSASGRRLD
ncbi:sn-glycerol-3-phosphate ABC transporter ATP-binding protein UgpC [Aurantimonas endophytica]|uniref:sn-glycerol 3-phosphate transport system ATP-binding protein n=1 Tax=Aurantimonas endophytica TaxID=1522175 RepID=A0A7W6HFX4_9HYPH|nr:sn-glycerol-3-phosphate ABC transporter ATP-binding protein UgpC [Aurantimonas endophytica]MBB4004479.1 sn-glycerol 3-phosphate transport system ATP-binding protein [Aurantimonas endophytica]MCO6405315.1 sn-glycerol-3-phosphate ABC transporter ATP-binding protein UgpC [Aurantimonas endophytica]